MTLLIPIILYPILIKSLGIAEFGHAMYYLSFVPFFSQFSVFGMNIFFSRLLRQTEDPREFDRITSEVTVLKIVFSILVSLIAFIVLFIQFPSEFSFVWPTALVIFLTGLVPNFYLLGKGRYDFVSGLNLLMKLLFIGMCLIFSRLSTNGAIVILAQAIGVLAAVILCLGHLKGRFIIHHWSFWRYSSFKELKSSFNIFVSNIFISLLALCYIYFLKQAVSMELVGLYAYTEKLIIGGKVVLGVFSTMIFTKLTATKVNLPKIFTYYFLPFLVCVAAGCGGISIFAPEFITLVRGPEATPVLLAKLVWVLFIIAANIWPYQSLLAAGKFKLANFLIIISSLWGIALSFVLISDKGLEGAINSFIYAELSMCITIYMGYIGFMMKRDRNEH